MTATAEQPYEFYLDQSYGERITPTHVYTGVTLPLLTQRGLPPVGVCEGESGRTVGDWNHNFHPKEALIDGTPLEKGLRAARVEWVARRDHDAYHREFVGPHLGKGLEQIRPLIFAAAGFIPHLGLTYDNHRVEAKIVPLSPRQRAGLWLSGRVKNEELILVRDALIDVGFQLGVEALKSSDVDRFLTETDIERRFNMGAYMLRQALNTSMPEISDQYRRLQGRRQLPPGAPKTIGTLAQKLVARTDRQRTVSAMEERLLRAA